jgi:hypothetical protein
MDSAVVRRYNQHALPLTQLCETLLEKFMQVLGRNLYVRSTVVAIEVHALKFRIHAAAA